MNHCNFAHDTTVYADKFNWSKDNCAAAEQRDEIIIKARGKTSGSATNANQSGDFWNQQNADVDAV